MINATGMWGREIAAMVGTRVPAVRRRAPVLRHREDGSHSRRPADAARSRCQLLREARARRAGRRRLGAEHAPVGRRTASRRISVPSCCSPISIASRRSREEAAERIPVLNEIGIRQMINGPIPITADGEPVIGLSPELDNFYLCCGFTSGIAASGGAGWVMANWIVDGDPGLDLWPFDVRRFGSAAFGQVVHVRARRRELRAATTTSRGRTTIPTRAAARGAVRCTRRCSNAGAVFGNKFGWERPELVRGSRARRAVEVPSFERGPAFEAIGAEHRAVRERVALIDMSSFSKYEVRGPGALALLQKLACNDRRPAGRHDRLHAALQRARRHRGRRHDHAPRARTASTSSPAARSACAIARRSSVSCRRGRQRRRSTSTRRRRRCSTCADRARATCSRGSPTRRSTTRAFRT